MAFLALKPECVKSSFYNVKIRVEKVIFICCCLRHPELHKYPALCGCQVRAPMQKCSSQTGKKCLKKGFREWFVFGNQHWFVAVLEVPLWVLCQCKEAPEGGWDGGEAVLGGMLGHVPRIALPFPTRVPRQNRSSASVMLTLPHVPEGTASPDLTDTCSSFNLAFQGG